MDCLREEEEDGRGAGSEGSDFCISGLQVEVEVTTRECDEGFAVVLLWVSASGRTAVFFGAWRG